MFHELDSALSLFPKIFYILKNKNDQKTRKNSRKKRRKWALCIALTDTHREPSVWWVNSNAEASFGMFWLDFFFIINSKRSFHKTLNRVVKVKLREKMSLFGVHKIIYIIIEISSIKIIFLLLFLFYSLFTKIKI